VRIESMSQGILAAGIIAIACILIAINVVFVAKAFVTAASGSSLARLASTPLLSPALSDL